MHSKHVHHLTFRDFIITLILLFKEGKADAIFQEKWLLQLNFRLGCMNMRYLTHLRYFLSTHISERRVHFDR